MLFDRFSTRKRARGRYFGVGSQGSKGYREHSVSSSLQGAINPLIFLEVGTDDTSDLGFKHAVDAIRRDGVITCFRYIMHPPYECSVYIQQFRTS